jgi:hypothetical protein
VKKVMLAGLVVVVTAAALAQETEQQKRTLETLRSRGMGISSGGSGIRSLLGTLLEDTGLSYVVDQSVGETQSMEFNGSGNLEELLRQALEPRGLDYLVRKDGVIFVSTKKHIEELKHGKKEEKPDLKPGELLFVLRDGSRIKGKVSIEKWNLKTAYGDLSIPSSAMKAIWPGNKREGASEEDKVETARFTVTGRLDIDKLEVDTGKGRLTVAGSDIKEILFPQPAAGKSLDVKPTGEWLDTGIKLEKGSKLRITATGKLEWVEQITFGPDGGFESPTGLWKTKSKEPPPPWLNGGFPLVARIGDKGEPFKVGSSFEQEISRDGALYLKIDVAETARPHLKDLKGAYSVKIDVQK